LKKHNQKQLFLRIPEERGNSPPEANRMYSAGDSCETVAEKPRASGPPPHDAAIMSKLSASRTSIPKALPATSGRIALTVFFFSGLLMAFPGAILPSWGYHLSYNFVEVGRYFLFMALGIALSAATGERLTRSKGTRVAVVLGCVAAALSLSWLAIASPPMPWFWRAAGVFGVGFAGGMLNSSAFQALSSLYERDPAATVNMAGTLFGLGCFAMAMIASGSILFYTARSTLVLLAVFPAFAAGLYYKRSFPAPTERVDRPLREILTDVRSAGAVLFSMLLFFQFGNEWSVAGWVAVYLVHRVGLSPDSALAMLGAYWLALTLGRIGAQALLPRIGHGVILSGSAIAAILGSLILAFTNNSFGSWSGLLLQGLGFAPIYPLVVEKIGHRFPNYHPGFYNGLLSFGITGGLIAPWALGYAASWWGIQTVMLLPFGGAFIVLVLILLLWLEARLTGTHT
jgi:fucose permease